MLNNNPIYRIFLEDYSRPRWEAAAKPYYGTMDDIRNLMIYLSENEETRIRYGDLIDAVEWYDMDNDAVHTVAGREFPVLMPAEEVCGSEVLLEEQQGYYTGSSDAVYPVWADRVYIRQILLRMEDGLHRCVKASFEGFRLCSSGLGWICIRNSIKGFPGVVTWADNTHTMNLFVEQEVYDFDNQKLAMTDTMDTNMINLVGAIGDIMGEI